ncbi:MarR family transcriptional regulator [Candidatus Woesearchaeota archaeon]|nr:MarR family transcriptional regulator [Candidatus Woesearchaeota archaeon]
MAILETKADQLMAVIDRNKSLTSKQAAKELGVTEDYVRRLAETLQKNGLIDLKASAFTLTLLAKQGS